jgi:hypothetical protein
MQKKISHVASKARSTAKGIWANNSLRFLATLTGLFIFFVVGWAVYSLTLRADTATTVSFNPESGTLANVTTVSDSSAAGGSSILFGAASTSNPNTVQIGSQSFPLTGTNVFRDVSQLVRFTYSTSQTITPTNQYGVEVVINSSTNKVTSVNNRIAVGSTTGTTIPSDSYVLSGHGQGAGTAGQWLLDNAIVGATVSLTGTGTPPPPPPPTGALPPKLIGAYWHMWQGPNVSEITANATNYNIQYASFAMGSDGNGNVAFNPVFQSGASLKNDITASKAAGSKWLISIGGGGDHTIRLLNETHATNMFNSLVGIIDSYGFQGIDYDLECGATCFNPDAAASLAQKLKTKYGSNFVISAAPRPYEARSSSSIYTSFALKAGNNLDIFGLQFYDFPETRNTAQLTSIINNDIATVVGHGIPSSKILIGAITYTQYNLGWNTVDVYKNIFLQQEQKYPDLRGVFIWDSSFDKKENWSFSRVMGPAVL